MKPKKKRNPNDATFRNINALKKRITRVEFKLETLIYILAQSGSSTKKPKGKK